MVHLFEGLAALGMLIMIASPAYGVAWRLEARAQGPRPVKARVKRSRAQRANARL